MTNISRRQCLGIIAAGALWPQTMRLDNLPAPCPEGSRRPFDVDLPGNPTPFELARWACNWERSVIEFNNPRRYQHEHYTGGIQWKDGWLLVYGVGPINATRADYTRLHKSFAEDDGILGECWTVDDRAWAIVVNAQCSEALAEDLRRSCLRQNARTQRRGKAVSV